MRNLHLILCSAIVALSSLGVAANELDPVNAKPPEGLVVKVGADGAREVYKVNALNGVVTNDQAAKAVVETVVQEANRIESLAPASELDKVSSEDSWYFSYSYRSPYSGYYSYAYNYGNSYYSYYPSYNYNYGGSRYSYYYTPSYYSGYNYSNYYYNNYNDSYGSHCHNSYDRW